MQFSRIDFVADARAGATETAAANFCIKQFERIPLSKYSLELIR